MIRAVNFRDFGPAMDVAVDTLADGAYFHLWDDTLRLGIGTEGLPKDVLSNGGRVAELERVLSAWGQNFWTLLVKNAHV